jgi:hypothetical protein
VRIYAEMEILIFLEAWIRSTSGIPWRCHNAKLFGLGKLDGPGDLLVRLPDRTRWGGDFAGLFWSHSCVFEALKGVVDDQD